MPAKAGIQNHHCELGRPKRAALWTPAFAGVTIAAPAAPGVSCMPAKAGIQSHRPGRTASGGGRGARLLWTPAFAGVASAAAGERGL